MSVDKVIEAYFMYNQARRRKEEDTVHRNIYEQVKKEFGFDFTGHLKYYSGPIVSREEAIERVSKLVFENKKSDKNIICVDGKPGVGKTTFAMDLGRNIGAVVIDGDDLCEKEIPLMDYLPKINSKSIVIDQIYSSDYQLNPLLSVCVEVDSENLRKKAILKRNRSDDDVLFDDDLNEELFFYFLKKRQNFDFIIDNTLAINSFVNN